MFINELRIGNVVSYQSLSYEVTALIPPRGIDPTYRVGFKDSELTKLVRDIHAVQLDDEWLITLNFAKIDWYSSRGGFYHSKTSNRETVLIAPRGDRGYTFLCEKRRFECRIEYVHRDCSLNCVRPEGE